MSPLLRRVRVFICVNDRGMVNSVWEIKMDGNMEQLLISRNGGLCIAICLFCYQIHSSHLPCSVSQEDNSSETVFPRMLFLNGF